MTRGGKVGRGARPAPALAALAMLALIVQLLIPASAMAEGQPASMIVCTSQGAVSLTLDAGGGHPAKGFGGLACQDCLASSLAALAAPPRILVPTPYGFAVEPAPLSPASARPRVHAPPRPPSQGPPRSVPD